MGETTLSTKTAFRGRLLSLETLEVELESGATSSREVVRHPGAVAVIARLPDGRFIFVRQFRKPIERELLEIVAGTLYPGEDPEACVRRELTEETGYVAGKVVDFGPVFNAPGYSDESIRLYFAEAEKEQGSPNPDDDEVIEVVYLDEAEIDKKIIAGEICDAKTVAAWWFYQTQIAFKGEEP